MDKITLKARAKINLTLDVKRRLESGYHQVDMIMQQLELNDEIEITTVNENGGIKVRTDHSLVPGDRNNLAYKAARLIKDTYNISRQANIRINKNIPVAAGLGGGSADAAAVILGLNRIWKLGLDISSMMRLGIKLGADVPFCILGGTALAGGTGEVLTPVSSAPSMDILLVKPDFMVSTASVYSSLDVASISERPSNAGMIGALEAGDKEGIASRMYNVLEEVTVKRHPEIDIIKKAIIERGALGAVMSGSGPTVAGVFENGERAHRAAKDFSKEYKEVIVTKTVT